MIVGIDLAGAQHRQTGICILKGLMAKTKILYSDDEIISETKKIKPKLIAIDAPLSLPKGRKSLKRKSSFHFRKCDLELRKMGIKFFPITLGPMRMLTERGMDLKKKLERLGFEVIEVYPGGAQDVLGLPRARDTKNLRKGLIELGIKGIKSDITEHELDAITCALVGKMKMEGKTISLGDPSEGQIIMPKGIE